MITKLKGVILKRTAKFKGPDTRELLSTQCVINSKTAIVQGVGAFSLGIAQDIRRTLEEGQKDKAFTG